jgi:hypothetical protein
LKLLDPYLLLEHPEIADRGLPMSTLLDHMTGNPLLVVQGSVEPPLSKIAL